MSLEEISFKYRNIGRTEEERESYDLLFQIVLKCQIAEAHRFVRRQKGMTWQCMLLMHLSQMKENPFVYQAWRREEKEIIAILQYKDPILDGSFEIPSSGPNQLSDPTTGRLRE